MSSDLTEQWSNKTLVITLEISSPKVSQINSVVPLPSKMQLVNNAKSNGLK